MLPTQSVLLDHTVKYLGEFPLTQNFSGIFLASCKCLNPCNNTIYNHQIEYRRDADIIQGSSSTIMLYFPSNLVTELTEVISYDWNIFLADVGGSVGFLLGLSVIGFVTVIEEVVKLIFRIGAKKEKLPELQEKEGESLKSVMEFVANCDMYEEKNGEKNKF